MNISSDDFNTEIFKDESGQWGFNLVDKDSQVHMTRGSFKSKSEAKIAANNFLSGIIFAGIIEITKKLTVTL